MPAAFSYGPIKSKKELGALLDILGPTFNFTRTQGDLYSRIVGVKNYRVIRSDRTVLGGCALLPMGQFFGGKSVPMIGVAAVGIAPEHRGRRTATFLMQSALHEMHKRGIAISSLYPATLPLYRSVGYEQAGARYEMRLPAKTLIGLRSNDGMQIRGITAKDEPAIRKVYNERARHAAGNLDRSDFIWFRVKSPRGTPANGFAAVNTATKSIEGYCYFVQKENTEPHDAAHGPLVMHCTDLVALTPAAGKALLAFLAHHRSMIDQIYFQGSPDDVILKLMLERNFGAKLLDHWMLRVVDVKAALLARGYPPVDLELHLDVKDDLIATNTGRSVLSINGGKPRVSNGGRGDLAIDIRGLAALFAGHLSPHALMATGQLECSKRLKPREEEEILAAASCLFAGPNPWLGDMF